jgi:hypothetical protein
MKSDSHETRTADGAASVALLQLFGNVVPAVNPGSAPGIQSRPGQLIAVKGLTAAGVVILPATIGAKPNECMSVGVVDADGSSLAHNIVVQGDVPISGAALGVTLNSLASTRAGAMFFFSPQLNEWVVMSCCAAVIQDT